MIDVASNELLRVMITQNEERVRAIRHLAVPGTPSGDEFVKLRDGLIAEAAEFRRRLEKRMRDAVGSVERN